MRTPQKDTALSYVWFVLRHGLSFAVWGPVIGAFFSPGVVMLPLAIVTAYCTSIPSAFLTGCGVGVASTFIARPRTVYIIAALMGAAFSAPVGLFFAREYDSTNWMVIHAISGAVAALICTLLARNTRIGTVTPAR